MITDIHHRALLRINSFEMQHDPLRCTLNEDKKCDIEARIQAAYDEQGGFCPAVPGHFLAQWNGEHKLDLMFVEDLLQDER